MIADGWYDLQQQKSDVGWRNAKNNKTHGPIFSSSSLSSPYPLLSLLLKTIKQEQVT